MQICHPHKVQALNCCPADVSHIRRLIFKSSPVKALLRYGLLQIQCCEPRLVSRSGEPYLCSKEHNLPIQIDPRNLNELFSKLRGSLNGAVNC